MKNVSEEGRVNIVSKYWELRIKQARKGSVDAGKECFNEVRSVIFSDELEHPIREYISSCIWDYFQGVPLTRALNLEEEKTYGGPPIKYDKYEIIAADVILRIHCGFGKEQSISWLGNVKGIDRTTIQSYRKITGNNSDKTISSAFENLDLDVLFHYSGAMRDNLRGVIPQT